MPTKQLGEQFAPCRGKTLELTWRYLIRESQTRGPWSRTGSVPCCKLHWVSKPRAYWRVHLGSDNEGKLWTHQHIYHLGPESRLWDHPLPPPSNLWPIGDKRMKETNEQIQNSRIFMTNDNSRISHVFPMLDIYCRSYLNIFFCLSFTLVMFSCHYIVCMYAEFF